MKDVNSEPDLPEQRPFKNSVEGDDSRMKKMEKGNAPSGDCDGEKPRNGPNKPLIHRLSSNEHGNFILDYFSKNELYLYPFANSSILNEFTKNSPQDNVYSQQLRNRISGFKEKYMKILQGEVVLGTHEYAEDQNEFDEEMKKGSSVGEEFDLSMYLFLKGSLHFGKINALVLILGENTVEASLSFIGTRR
ncbi:hypothetical protein Acr_18g0007390 [Actinidia rufa]|uniref:Uncharacterized protein n=1 Tax=Actinidia rufa TaxID=165716 RepID=A0A7J0G722_9ERIC|nr:hypothetical protein Acr_18g0007390 [Actinidia rufa]